MAHILNIYVYTIDLLILIRKQLLLVCRTGYFGQDCAMKCRDTCTGCNNINGLCDKGCHPGWKGDYCDERNGFKYVLRCILWYGISLKQQLLTHVKHLKVLDIDS